jgi:FdhE protein
MTPLDSSGSRALPDDIVSIRMPDAARTFEARAARGRALAPSHAAVREYLGFLAAIADAQALACREMPVAIDDHVLASPIPLPADAWPRTPAWRHALDRIVRHLSCVSAPAETTASLSRLGAMTVEQLDDIANAVLRSAVPSDPGASVFVAAALQVYWTTLAALVPLEAMNREHRSRCPVCGSLPVAGLVLGDQPLRYLTCWLCATAWHVTRLTCAHCGSADGLSYFAIEGAPPGTKAEACARCHRYLKLFYVERLPTADPLVDDVASIALDLLLADEGFTRAGVNPFLATSPQE